MVALILFLFLAPGRTFAETAKAPPPPPPAPVTPTSVAIGARFDCLHDFNIDKGDTQGCLNVSGLRLGIQHQAAPNLHARLRLDPFSTPRLAAVDSPLRNDLPTTADTSLGIIDDFGVQWQARPALEVAIETPQAAADLPAVSGLSTANSLQNLGWRQTALTVAYNLSVPIPMRVKFIGGNGEGEPSRNLDPQQFFGFRVEANAYHGVRAVIGVSLDGNDVGSEESVFLTKRYQSQCANGVPDAVTAKLGHSTQRLAAGIILDGTLPGAEGLKLGLGWQRDVATDTDKSHRSAPTADDYDTHDCRIDPDTVFVEDPHLQSVNSVQRTVYDVSLNYKLFSSYFVAADYTTRKLDTGSEKLFAVCHGFTGTTCNAGADNGVKSNRITQDAFSVGGGTNLTEGLTLSLEYFKSSYDQPYTRAYYVGEAGKATATYEAFNARVAYDWQ